MQRKYLLLKVLFSIAAIAAQVRLHVPQYALKLRYGPHGVSITLARITPEQTKEQAASAAVAGGPPAAGTIAATGTPSAHEAANRSGSASPAAPPDASGPKPVIEFMNIAKEGTSVLAGKAEPGARVTIYENATVVGSVTAGPEGDWSLATEHRFASADPSSALRAESWVPAPASGSTPASVGEARPGESRTAAATAPAPAAQTGAGVAAPGESPAAHLIKEFEGTVEAARSEAAREKAASEATPASEAKPVSEAKSVGGSEPPAAGQGAASQTQTAAVAEPSVMQPQGAPQPTIIPIPMQFVFREATLTEDGEKATALLLEYLKLKKLDRVALSGHADERGSEEFNMQLSRERLETVVRRLRAGGYTGKIDMLPKGKSEPFTGIDRSRISYEDLMQLDRRVELRVGH